MSVAYYYFYIDDITVLENGFVLVYLNLYYTDPYLEESIIVFI